MRTDHEKAALGGVIRDRRKKLQLSQQQLGEQAGYKKGPGAGVTIFRIESGKAWPRPEALAQIAQALGTTAGKLEDEAELAAQAPNTTGAGALSLRDRRTTIEERFEKRSQRIQASGSAYNHHAQACREDFAVPFIELCNQIAHMPSAPEPPPAPPLNAGARERVKWASGQFNWAFAGAASVGAGAAGAGLGGIGAAGLFAAVSALGSASTGVAISGLSGIAAWNAAMAAIGGGAIAAGGFGIAGGMAVLGAVVALPAVIAAGGVFAIARIRDQRKQLVKVVEAEEFLDRTASRYRAVLNHLEGSNAVLVHAATYATRRFELWRDGLTDAQGKDIRDWEQLTEHQQTTQQDLVRVVSCLAILLALDPQALMNAPSAVHPTPAEFSTRSDDDGGETLVVTKEARPVADKTNPEGESADQRYLATFEELNNQYEVLRRHTLQVIKQLV